MLRLWWLSLLLLANCVAEQRSRVLDSEQDEPFVSVWQVEAGKTIWLPLPEGYSYDFVVDWGDGSQSEITGADDPHRMHVYAETGSYTVRISGLVEAWQANIGRGCVITSVPDLGDVGWKNLRSAFFTCRKLTEVQGGDVSQVTDMREMFAHADAANPDVRQWDVSNVTDMSFMFYNTSAANPDVSQWDTSNVTNMSGMFKAAYVADPDVSQWDTSNVTDMSGMFNEANSATPDLSRWDFSKVTCYGGLFESVTLPTATYSNVLLRIAETSDKQGGELCYYKRCLVWGERPLSGGIKESRSPRSRPRPTATRRPPCYKWEKVPSPLSAGKSKYNAAAAVARQTLIDRGWVIEDGGQE